MTELLRKLHNKYRVKLCSLNQEKNPDLKFKFVDYGIMRGGIPRLPKQRILRVLERNEILLSDMEPEILKSRCL